MNRFEELNARSIEWAKAKGILEHGTDIGQSKKTVEEAEELFYATVNGDVLEQADAIGDLFICITIMAKRLGLNPLDCFESALEIVEKRSGKIIDGQFVKD